jgi:uncharacterized NAD(P)/FAD-binding protein YdhS
LHVAIVGMGPRGLSVFERLLVRLCAQPPSIPVVIWAIEPVEHGPGRVWRTDQPGWLTMNATAGEVTVLSPDNHVLDPSAPVAAPSFAQWTAGARRAGLQLQSADYPDAATMAVTCARCSTIFALVSRPRSRYTASAEPPPVCTEPMAAAG